MIEAAQGLNIEDKKGGGRILMLMLYIYIFL